VWRWLGQHPDISIGKDNEHDRTPLQQLAKPDIPLSDQANSLPSIAVTDERVYRAICGHPPDDKRIFRFEYGLLLHIAAAGAAGILQGELGRIADQDKRSVPKRTDSLHAKGYIVKEPVLVKGNKTSRLTLRRFATQEQLDGAEQSLLARDFPTIGDRRERTVHDLVNHVVQLFSTNPLIEIEHLAKQVQMTTEPARKILQQLTKVFIKAGYLKKIKAAIGSAAHTGEPKLCLQSQREFSPGDLDGLTDSQLALARPLAEINLEGDVDAQQNSLGQDVPLAQWNPDRSIAHALRDAAELSGIQGMSNIRARELVTGLNMRRPIETQLTRLSCASLLVQPKERRHLSIVRTIKGHQYLHNSYTDFVRLAERDKQRIASAPGAGLLLSQTDGQDDGRYDDFGFPILPDSRTYDSLAQSVQSVSADDWAGFDRNSSESEPETPVKKPDTTSRRQSEPRQQSTNVTPEATPVEGKRTKRIYRRRPVPVGEEQATLGRPRKFLPGTEKFWQHHFWHARLAAEGGADAEGKLSRQRRTGTANHPAGLALFRNRPTGFDEMALRAMNAGLPVPRVAADISQDWIRCIEAVLGRQTPGVYLTPPGMKVGKSVHTSQHLIVRSNKLDLLDLHPRPRVFRFRFHTSSVAHSSQCLRWYPALPRSRKRPAPAAKSFDVDYPDHLLEAFGKLPRMGVFLDEQSTAQSPAPPTLSRKRSRLTAEEIALLATETDVDSDIEQQTRDDSRQVSTTASRAASRPVVKSLDKLSAGLDTHPQGTRAQYQEVAGTSGSHGAETVLSPAPSLVVDLGYRRDVQTPTVENPDQPPSSPHTQPQGSSSQHEEVEDTSGPTELKTVSSPSPSFLMSFKYVRDVRTPTPNSQLNRDAATAFSPRETPRRSSSHTFTIEPQAGGVSKSMASTRPDRKRRLTQRATKWLETEGSNASVGSPAGISDNAIDSDDDEGMELQRPHEVPTRSRTPQSPISHQAVVIDTPAALPTPYRAAAAVGPRHQSISTHVVASSGSEHVSPLTHIDEVSRDRTIGHHEPVDAQRSAQISEEQSTYSNDILAASSTPPEPAPATAIDDIIPAIHNSTPSPEPRSLLNAVNGDPSNLSDLDAHGEVDDNVPAHSTLDDPPKNLGHPHDDEDYAASEADSIPPTTVVRTAKRKRNDEEEESPRKRAARPLKRPGIACRKALLDLFQITDGLAPNDAIIIRRFLGDRWQRLGLEGLPSRQVIKRSIKALVNAGQLREHTFAFRGKGGLVLTKSLVYPPDVEMLDPRVQTLKQELVKADILDYVPPLWVEQAHLRIDLSPELRDNNTEDEAVSEAAGHDSPPPRRPKRSFVSPSVATGFVTLRYRHDSPTSEPGELPPDSTTGFVTLKVPRLGTLPQVQAYAHEQPANVIVDRPEVAIEPPEPSPPPKKPRRPRVRKPKADGLIKSIWKKSKVPSTLAAMLAEQYKFDPEICPSGPRDDAARFVDELYTVLEWEERLAARLIETKAPWTFINHEPGLGSETAGAPPMSWLLVTYDQSGMRVESEMYATESWLPFVQALEKSRLVQGLDDAVVTGTSKRRITRQATGSIQRKRRFEWVDIEPEDSMAKRARKNADTEFVDSSGKLQEVLKKKGNPIESQHAMLLARTSNEDIFRVALTVTLTKILVGGAMGTINWTAVVKMNPGVYRGWLSSRWKAIDFVFPEELQSLTDDLRSKYLEAVAHDEVPMVNFSNHAHTDWQGIIEWAVREIPSFLTDNILPSSRKTLDSRFIMTYVEGMVNPLLVPNQSMRGFEVEDHTVSVPFSGSVYTAIPSGDRVVVARPIVLSALLVEELDAHSIAVLIQKLTSIAENQNDAEQATADALQYLQKQHLISKNNPGLKRMVALVEDGQRAYSLNESFGKALDEKRIINRSILKEAVSYKLETLDEAFVVAEAVNIPNQHKLRDGQMVALINLMANGMLQLRPGAGSLKSVYGVAWERLGDNMKDLDAEDLGFDVVVQAQHNYVIGDLAESSRRDAPKHGVAGHVPVWVSLNGELFVETWEQIAAAVVGIVSISPGVVVQKIVEMLDGVITEWEASTVLQWAFDSGFVERTGTGIASGWTPRPMWWLCIGTGVDWEGTD
jgi:hypothetical protein